MLANGIRIGQEDAANFYVAVKSKPLAILTGPARSGKTELVQSLAEAIHRQDHLRFQMIAGHPWQAQEWGSLTQFTSLHIRFLTEKMLAMIEEAAQPENANRLFIACLKRISPAELLSFFTEVAYQIQHGQVMRIGDTHLSEPIPFPPNLRVLGTMDTGSFKWWDNDLLLSTTIIQWPFTETQADLTFHYQVALDEREFLDSCIRDRDKAYRKMLPILKRQRQPLFSLMQIEKIMKRYTSVSMEMITNEVMIYLANSWTRLGHGLFSPSPERNLAIALDTAIAQIALPRAADALQSMEKLRIQLASVFGDRYWRSMAFVSMLSSQSSEF